MEKIDSTSIITRMVNNETTFRRALFWGNVAPRKFRVQTNLSHYCTWNTVIVLLSTVLSYVWLRKTQKIVISLCLLRPCLLRVLWCSVCFCTGHFVMMPINLTCPHWLQHVFFEHLLHLYFHYMDREAETFQGTVMT